LTSNGTIAQIGVGPGEGTHIFEIAGGEAGTSTFCARLTWRLISFTGILVAAAAALHPVVAIDEPEAFLHPPQAFLIGKALATLRGSAPLYIATHSADVLRGILPETQEVNVIRFSQRGDSYRTKRLDIQALKSISADPVLKSAIVLDGLFYNGVVVTESDGDVALYRAVLDDMDRALSVTFVNSYTKQSSVQVGKPLRAGQSRLANLVVILTSNQIY
jgi:hypothetical protein